MTDVVTINQSDIDQWISSNMDQESIKEELRRKGLDEVSIDVHLAEFKKRKHARNLRSGFGCIAIGSFIGLIGCIIAMVNPVPEYYNWFLYGFASVAVVVAFIGLVLIFE